MNHPTLTDLPMRAAASPGDRRCAGIIEDVTLPTLILNCENADAALLMITSKQWPSVQITPLTLIRPTLCH